MEEKVILVDENDTVAGEMEKMEAHKQARLHRAVSVFIFNAHGQLLIQQRALNKYHSPGLWTNTACTHPRPNESNEMAAERRLFEEMGIRNVQLIRLFDFIYREQLDGGLTEYELDHVFVGTTDDIPIPDPSEVFDFKYINPELLIQKILDNPERFTVWFKKIITRVLDDVKK